MSFRHLNAVTPTYLDRGKQNSQFVLLFGSTAKLKDVEHGSSCTHHTQGWHCFIVKWFLDAHHVATKTRINCACTQMIFRQVVGGLKVVGRYGIVWDNGSPLEDGVVIYTSSASSYISDIQFKRSHGMYIFWGIAHPSFLGNTISKCDCELKH